MERERTITWPGWEVVRLIGRGGFGEVYEIRRDVFGHEEKAALKVITIPQSNQDVKELWDDGYSGEEITDHFQSVLKDIIREYALMSEMKGHTNIIYCDDLRYIQHDDGFGWDIYIKMELLTPLPEKLGQQVSDEQVIRVGIDICNALLLCGERNIIHRDIKPQNIFVSDDGNYKLGDFGIAKTVERTASGTRIGTYKYIAPEVYNNQPYGSAADVYSLGLVLYWMLNERRTPFLPLPPQRPTASVDEEARRRRLSGESLPLPAHGSRALQQIVMKACAFAPKSRYTAEELKAALEALLPAKKPEHFSNDDEETVLLVNEPALQPAELPNLSMVPHPVPEPASRTPEPQPERIPKTQAKLQTTVKSEKKPHHTLFIILVLLVVVVAGVVLLHKKEKTEVVPQKLEGENLLAAGDQGNLITLDDVTCMGHSVIGLDIDTISTLIHQNGLKYYEDSDGDNYFVSGGRESYSGAEITAMQNKSEDYVCLWGYTHFYYEDGDSGPTLPIGLQGINTHDSLGTVLTKLGFTNGEDIANYAYELMGQEYTEKEKSAFYQRLRSLRYDKMCFDEFGEGNDEQTESGSWKPIALQFSWYFVGSDNMNYHLSFKFEQDMLTEYLVFVA